jgi:hypothetical protein
MIAVEQELTELNMAISISNTMMQGYSGIPNVVILMG